MANMWVEQLYQLLEDDLCHPYIHWNKAGNGLVIVDQQGFVDHVLPRYYTAAGGWPSFLRNLGNYSFDRVHDPSYKHHYIHDMFHRGCKNVLHLVSFIFSFPFDRPCHLLIDVFILCLFITPSFFFSPQVKPKSRHAHPSKTTPKESEGGAKPFASFKRPTASAAQPKFAPKKEQGLSYYF